MAYTNSFGAHGHRLEEAELRFSAPKRVPILQVRKAKLPGEEVVKRHVQESDIVNRQKKQLGV